MSEVIEKNSGFIVMREHVGEGTITNEDGSQETFKVSTTLSTRAPVIEFENGNYVVLSWEDIVGLAKDVEKKTLDVKGEIVNDE